MKDPRIPRWLRWLVGVGLLPIPPLDVVVTLIAALILLLFYRRPFVEAWRASKVDS